jgi:multicomponent Na+:H+ antiporter subunit B
MIPVVLDVCLLTLLAFTALIIVRLRGLFATAMLTGIYSFIGAGWMLLLDAPDVAFTEAAVGAGISTVLILGTLALTTEREKKPVRRSLMPLFVVVVTGAVLIYGTIDMPRFGDPLAPEQLHVAPEYLADTVPNLLHRENTIEVQNVVTSVLASYRGYDTLGETTVIFTAAIAVLLLLRGRRRRPGEEHRG